jgi:hypothetical protein
MRAYLNSRQPTLAWEVGDGSAAFEDRSSVELGEELTLLTDLSEWVSPARLKVWIEQEIERLNGDSSRIAESLWQRLDVQPKMLLALLSFAYATRVFCPEDIVERCYSDAMFRLICEGSVPFVQELSNFRRRNRRLLERILVGVFLQAIRDKFDLDVIWLSPELLHDLNGHAKVRLDLARHMDTR